MKRIKNKCRFVNNSNIHFVQIKHAFKVALIHTIFICKLEIFFLLFIVILTHNFFVFKLILTLK